MILFFRRAEAVPSLLFASAIGASQSDTIRAIATDASQNIYIVGDTYSSNFLGAANSSSARMAVDAAGNAYVTGVTTSANFPVTAGAVQRFSASAGIEDAFVVKITPAGGIAFSTYLGGSDSDTGLAIAVDQNSAAYVAGSRVRPTFR